MICFRTSEKAREGFALTQQPSVHVLEKRLAFFLEHGAPLVGAAAVDGALDLELAHRFADGIEEGPTAFSIRC